MTVPNQVICDADGNQIQISEYPNAVNIYEDGRNQICIDPEAPTVIAVQLLGTESIFARRHVHTQASPSTSWVITHALKGKPQVTVVDTADTCVVGDVIYNSDTQITVSFSAAFAGNAYLT